MSRSVAFIGFVGVYIYEVARVYAFDDGDRACIAYAAPSLVELVYGWPARDCFATVVSSLIG
jgi:hypothetical protein